MGYDAILHDGASDRRFLDRGAGEGRVVLSRKKSLARREYRGTLLVIEADSPEEQIGEVLERLGLMAGSENLLTRCLSCNELLEPVSPHDLKGRVPPYVLETHQTFHFCPQCGSLFWPGTHREGMIRFLKKRSLMDLP